VRGDPAARERRCRHLTAGAYRLRRQDRPVVTLAAMGALVPTCLVIIGPPHFLTQGAGQQTPPSHTDSRVRATCQGDLCEP
jgi:hypothetical protein